MKSVTFSHLGSFAVGLLTAINGIVSVQKKVINEGLELKLGLAGQR